MVDRRAHGGDERGAVLLLVGMVMIVVLMVTALVTDLGLTRSMRRSNQTLVDLAALSAGGALGQDAGPNGPAACADAVRYLEVNADDLDGLNVDCVSLAYPCLSATGPTTVSQTTGSYKVDITYPVADPSIADPQVNGGQRIEDGQPCERLRVSVTRTESAIFAGIVGMDSLTVSASAVVRQIAAQDRQIPSLWLLAPHQCDVLTVQGGARVTVGTAARAGLISADSDGTACSGNSYTVDVGGSGSLLQSIPTNTTPAGAISLFAMAPGQTRCDTGNLRACDPADVANATLAPQPVRRGWRATRAPVDHTYNCRASYPDYFSLSIAPCEDATGAYIDQLRAAVGTTGIPAGFNRWRSSHSCSPSGAITVTGNWVVDCADFRLGNGSAVSFSGGNVIFNGAISMTGSGSLRINDANTGALPEHCRTTITGCLAASSPGAAWAYMRGGDLRLNGGNLNLSHTMLYQHDGNFTINGSAPPIWSAPSEGPFAGLAVWSEKAATFSISGGASMDLEGVFFTPYADPFTLSGGAPFLPQQAQFISYRAKIDGGAVLTLAPNQGNPIILPAPPAALIR